MTKNIWPLDGSQHNDVSKSSLYQTQAIKTFLRNDQFSLVIATKGMGKTLLLRVKKKILEEETDGILVIPRNQEYDQPEFRGVQPWKRLDEIDLWRDIWSASIQLSVLTHTFTDDDERDSKFLEASVDRLDCPDSFSKDIKECIRMGGLPPSYFVSLLLRRSVTTIERFLASSAVIDSLSQRFITSAAYLFIDGLDQTLSDHYGAKLGIWRNAQLGLAHAVHRLNSKNRHIKVFASLRQEAWADLRADDRQVIGGRAIQLSYDRRELRELFTHAMRRYNNKSDISSFLGIDSVPSMRTDEREECFDYIYRHSTGTPRSLMGFGLALHNAQLLGIPEDERIDAVRETVNRVGSQQVYYDYLLSQRLMFLNSLDSEEQLRWLLELIPSNILRGDMLKFIRERYLANHPLDLSAVDEEESAKATADYERQFHPFSELLNIGLIGFVTRDASKPNFVQHFRNPNEFEWNPSPAISDERIYIVHPSLHGKLYEQKPSYQLHPSNIIGDGRNWDDGDGSLFPCVFLSHSSNDKPVINTVIPRLKCEIVPETACDFWYDSDQIATGEDFSRELEKGISNSDLVLVFVSNTSMKSGWVEREWRDKHTKEVEDKAIRVVPCIIDDTPVKSLPKFLRSKNCIYLPDANAPDFSRAIAKLGRDVTKHLKSLRGESPPETSTNARL